MTDTENLSVTLPKDIVAELRAAVEGGDYGSVSDVLDDALRTWHSRRQAEIVELRQLIQDGIKSGPGHDGIEVFATMRARLTDPPLG